MPRIPRRLQGRFYRDARGGQPVEEFVSALPLAHQFAVYRMLERIDSLDEKHSDLAYPYSSQIEGELRELRCHYGNIHYRILYRRSEQFVVLLHAFRKATAATPERDKEIARRRWADFKKRMDEAPRSTPSPIGKRGVRLP
ncbi:MAG TPA: type II toxin-antitoxin system RelE/ParE family toxin [Candidatus Elarobacter sp.]|nr:type II toxin-antitoxin system RelE/ParE family toxin [Candidatus Elarobacter sp.]